MFIFSFISFLHLFHPVIKAATKVHQSSGNARLFSGASFRPPSSGSCVSNSSSLRSTSYISHRRLPLPSETELSRSFHNRRSVVAGGTIERLHAVRDRLCDMLDYNSHDDLASPCEEVEVVERDSDCYTPDLFPRSLLYSSESGGSLAEFEEAELLLAKDEGDDMGRRNEYNNYDLNNHNVFNSSLFSQCSSITNEDDDCPMSNRLCNGYARRGDSSLHSEVDSMDRTDIGFQDVEDTAIPVEYDSEDSLTRFERFELAIAQDSDVSDTVH